MLFRSRERTAIAVDEVETAAREVGQVYDHVLVNDELEAAVREVIELVRGHDVAPRTPHDAAQFLSGFARQLQREAAQLRQSTGRSSG